MIALRNFLQRFFQPRGDKNQTSLGKTDDLDLEGRVFEIAEEHGLSPDAVLTMASLAAEEYTEKVSKWHTLTPRQQEVAALICVGHTNREIARQLNISISTVKTHIRYILQKFGLNGKDQLRQYFDDWDFSHFFSS